MQVGAFGKGSVSIPRKRSRSDGQQCCGHEFEKARPAVKRPSSGQQRLHLQQLECTLRAYMLRHGPTSFITTYVSFMVSISQTLQSDDALRTPAPDGHDNVVRRRWSRQLTALQPKCVVEDRLIEHGIAIFDAFSNFYMEQVRFCPSHGTLFSCPDCHSYPSCCLSVAKASTC